MPVLWKNDISLNIGLGSRKRGVLLRVFEMPFDLECLSSSELDRRSIVSEASVWLSFKRSWLWVSKDTDVGKYYQWLCHKYSKKRDYEWLDAEDHRWRWWIFIWALKCKSSRRCHYHWVSSKTRGRPSNEKQKLL